MKAVKIDVPEGYEIDKEKSTFENIVFKKVDKVVIKWNDEYGGVEIKAGEEYFVIDAESPSLHCSWNDAMRYYNARAVLDWNLPTVKQLQVIAKHSDEINKVIRINKGFEIRGGWLWSRDEMDKYSAWVVFMGEGSTGNDNKCLNNCVRAVHTL